MRINKYLRSQNGVTPTGAIIFVIAATVVILVAVSVLKPYINTFLYNEEIVPIVKKCISKSDLALQNRLIRAAEKKGLKLKKSDIIIRRSENKEDLEVKLRYTLYIDLPLYKRTFVFRTSTAQSMGKGGISGDIKKKQSESKGTLNKAMEFLGL
ncbi:hypothetical protein ACFL2A_00290 [Thermodesulfobacteriota bacterium]